MLYYCILMRHCSQPAKESCRSGHNRGSCVDPLELEINLARCLRVLQILKIFSAHCSPPGDVISKFQASVLVKHSSQVHEGF